MLHDSQNNLQSYIPEALHLHHEALSLIPEKSSFDPFPRLHKLQNLGFAFLNVMLLSFSSWKYEDDEQLLQILSRDLSQAEIKLLLGIAVEKSIKEIPWFEQFRERVQGAISQIEKKENQISISLNSSSDQEHISETLYTLIEQKKQNFNESPPKVEDQPMKKSLQQMDSNTQIDITFDTDFKNSISFDLFKEEENQDPNDKTENEEVEKYLLKLSKATTQLSYLCQHMKWAQPHFEQKRSEINDNIFEARIAVLVRRKNMEMQMFGECHAALSKKEARRVASLFLLKNIYNSFPDVWENFKLIRSMNEGIQIPLNANNQEIFNKAKVNGMELTIFKQKAKSQVKNEEDVELTTYMEDLKSAKSQINLLNGKFKKLSPPSISREMQDGLGLWPVTAEISYGSECFKSEAKESNKKKAEEKCCRDLLFQFYKRFPQVWEEFKGFKKVKNL